MKNRIKAHLKGHIKIYVPLAVLVMIVTSTIAVQAYDEYSYTNSYGDNTWDYSGPTWTPSTYDSSDDYDSDDDSSDDDSSDDDETSSGSTSTDGCRSDLMPAGTLQVIADSSSDDISYFDNGKVIPELIGGSYIYMKNSDGKADYNYIVGNYCKLVKTQSWGYVYPEKIKAAKVKMAEEAQKEPSSYSFDCEDVSKGSVKVLVNEDTYAVSYYDTKKLISDVAGQSGASYLYMKDPKTGKGDYDYVVGYECDDDWGYIYPTKIELAKKKIGITTPSVSPAVTTTPAVVTKKTVPPAGYEEPVENLSYATFTDIDSSTLEGEAAANLYSRAIIGGYEDGEFKGDRPVNRAEAAKFLLLAKKITVEDGQNNGKFMDVAEKAWYSKYVMKAANLGIINGYADGSFKPGETVNTVEFLKMIAATFDLQEDLKYTYSDVSADKWFAKYAGIAEAYDLFPERTGSNLYPFQKLTRKEVAIAIYRILVNLEG